jgi:hypothetical protein
LVPIIPYQTESVLVSIGQRYDVIVEANAAVDNYWLRSGYSCSGNGNPANITGIVRYDSSSTADPTTTAVTAERSCGDEPLTSLVPYLAMNVGNFSDNAVIEEALSSTSGGIFNWTLNSSTLYLNWSDPTTLKIFNHENLWPTDYNVVPIDVKLPQPGDMEKANWTTEIQLHQ